MRTSTIILVMLFLVPWRVYSLEMKGVAAWPVPFNPRQTVLTVDQPGSSLGAHSVRMAVYDINGDTVVEKRFSTFPIKWNGRNGTGRIVKPGMYILKVEVDDPIDGNYGKKIIRILINY